VASMAYTVDAYRRRGRWHAGLVWGLLVGLTGLLALLVLSHRGEPVALGWALYLAGVALIFYQPRYGIYFILGGALSSDLILAPWNPLIKNFSSRESPFYLGDAYIITPAELYMALTLAAWWAHMIGRRQVRFVAGSLFAPVAAFGAMMAAGLAWGMTHGGSLNIALWECRAIFYLPLIYVLVVNLLDDARQVNTLVWVIVAALALEGVLGAYHYIVVLGLDLSGVAAITEHSAAIHMNTILVLLIATFIYGGSWGRKLALLAVLPPIALTYIATQRRAAFVSIAIALVVIAVLLYVTRRRLFWQVVPISALAALAYLAAFWNSSGALGLPARGIRSAFAGPGDVEYASNIYRVLENVNTSFTIHQSPLFGVGFGRPFFILAPLADISFFVFWQYITHNSILWIWMKAGVLGFVSLLYLIGSAIVQGVHVFGAAPCGKDQAGSPLRPVVLTFLCYIIMHFVYAYVDMSWDTQSMIYLGMAIGVLGWLPGRTTGGHDG